MAWQERPPKPQLVPLEPERLEDVRKLFNLDPVAFRIICTRKCEGFNKEELIEFLYFCKSLKLDPAMDQVHGIVRWSWEDDKWKKSISKQTAIEGLRALAEMNEDYAGNDEPIFHWQLEGEHEVKTGPVFPSGAECLAVTCAVYRYGKNGEKLRFGYTAYQRDYAQRYGGKLTSMWEKTGIMLPKCAEAGALRKGWPQVMKNLYITEEMMKALEDDQRSAQPAAETAQPTESKPSAEQPAKEEKKAAPEAEKTEKKMTTQQMAQDIAAALRDKYKDKAGARLKEFITKSSGKEKYEDVSQEVKGAVVKAMHILLSTGGPVKVLETIEEFFNPKPKEETNEGGQHELGPGAGEPGDAREPEPGDAPGKQEGDPF